MPIKVTLPTAFTRHTDGLKQLNCNANDLPGLLAEIDTSFPALAMQIRGDDGKLRRFINVYINDEDIRFLGGDSYAFQDGDEVMLIPSIAGGSASEGNQQPQATEGWLELSNSVVPNTRKAGCSNVDYSRNRSTGCLDSQFLRVPCRRFLHSPAHHLRGDFVHSTVRVR